MNDVRGAVNGRQADVSVVIPTRNRRALLLRTVDSVLRQVDTNVDLVVVDDGGSDQSGDAVLALGHRNVRIVRHETSRGVSAARNAGLAVAKAPWVAFVDDDDLWAPTKLADQLASMSQACGARWSCVGAVHINEVVQVQRYRRPPTGEISGAMLKSHIVPGGGSGVLVETALAREVGGFDERISIVADWDFYLRLSLASPVAGVDAPLLGYFVHGDSMYHNPVGLLSELEFLVRKYPGTAGPKVEVDWGYWTINLIRMAMWLGDPKLAVQIGVRVARRGPAATFREVLGRLKPNRSDTARTEAERLLPRDLGWLDRYADVSRWA